MSIETRSNSALFKRAEQLKRWEDSETNREPVSPKQKCPKIKFSSGCVFLAACAAGDKEEVLKLLEKGADINTANVDGLTALHQACIDDNFDMVEFLVEHGADVNRGDNEGWTPLHATASCGFLYIAKFLLEKGADVAAVNNDGELAVDIAECQKMEDLLNDELNRRGIDCEAARNEEKRIMLQDALSWLSNQSSLVDVVHPQNGATALHVAAAKGYTDVMKILMQCGADVDTQDLDGWTPLHAAVHWGQKEACQILTENLADMDAKNYVGQTPFDLAESEMLKFLEELKKKQNKEEVHKRVSKKRLESDDRQRDAETPKNKMVKVDLIENNHIDNEQQQHDETIEKKNRVNSGMQNDTTLNYNRKNELQSRLTTTLPPSAVITAAAVTTVATTTTSTTVTTAPSIMTKPIEAENEATALPPWKTSLKMRQSKFDQPSSENFIRNHDGDHTSDDTTVNTNAHNENHDTSIKRTSSFKDNDKEFYAKYEALHARIQAYKDTTPLIPYNSSKTHSHLPNSFKQISQANYRRETSNFAPQNTDTNNGGATSPNNNTPNSATTSPSKTTSTSTSPLPYSNQTVPRRSFVPPVRDEESETQRKAHAKRVRETRRSTQGVTLEEIKSAEQFAKKKNQGNYPATTSPPISTLPTITNATTTSPPPTSTTVASSNSNIVSEPTSANNGDAISSSSCSSANEVNVTATITTASPTIITRENEDSLPSVVAHERRPSWRLRIDSSSKFKLEDATKPTEISNTPSFVRRTGLQSNVRPSSAPIETADTTVTATIKRPKSLDEKEQDKENDARNAQATLATQAAIQRRRRPKRRSTGVVSFDNVDDLDQEKDPAGGGECEENGTAQNHEESGSERSTPVIRSRLGSDVRNENGEIDYKKLYEQSIAENERLKDKLKKTEEELRETKQTLEKINVVTSRNSLSELEKRERRAMERKLSEMEEELKYLENMKAENQKLKDENGALIRVISKLSK